MDGSPSQDQGVPGEHEPPGPESARPEPHAGTGTVAGWGWAPDEEAGPARPERGRARRHGSFWLAVGCFVLGVAIAGGSLTAALSDYVRRSGTSSSMTPTFAEYSTVTAKKIGGSEVRRGDVVLVVIPRWGFDQAVMKRVIGVGGDHVVLPVDGPLKVNGTAVPEPYLYDGVPNGIAIPVDVTVPKGRLFLLGDHRADSLDSRVHLDEDQGTVPQAGVLGRIVPGVRVTGAYLAGTWLGGLLGAGGLVAAAVIFIRVRRRPAAPAAPAAVA